MRVPVLTIPGIGNSGPAHWQSMWGSQRLPIAGALLVAVPDPTGPRFPTDATGFAPVPLQRFAFASVVVASSDDPYGSLEYVKRCASAWGSRLVSIGAAGHINAASGLGEWREGYELLDALRGMKNGDAFAEAG
jgi:predicted alpha/beta hydrolase family esterase